MCKIIRPDTYFLVGLNVVDAASTHAALKLGWAYEANPIMAAAWDHSPLTFWLAKLLMIVLSLTLLSYTAKDRARALAITVCSAVYVFILSVHLAGWIQYLSTVFT